MDVFFSPDWFPDLLHRTHPRAVELTTDFIASRANPNTRAAYGRALRSFLLWAERQEFTSLDELTATRIGDYVRGIPNLKDHTRQLSKRSRAMVLACLRGYFDHLIRNGALNRNPSTAVEAPAPKAKKGAYTALTANELKAILDATGEDTVLDLQDKAMIAVMTFACARVSALTKLTWRDVDHRDGRMTLELDEKGDKRHSVPCNGLLTDLLIKFREKSAEGPLADPNPQQWMFRLPDEQVLRLTSKPVHRMYCWRRVKGRAKAAGIKKKVTNHTFRATGITLFLKAGGEMDKARRLANHASIDTTRLYAYDEELVQAEDVDLIKI